MRNEWEKKKKKAEHKNNKSVRRLKRNNFLLNPASRQTHTNIKTTTKIQTKLNKTTNSRGSTLDGGDTGYVALVAKENLFEVAELEQIARDHLHVAIATAPS
jgi:hypothetical protein